MLGGGAGRQWPAPWARGAGAGAGAGAGPSHFVTRSASKALMPWAALSRASSLAGGPCQKTASRCTPRCTHTGAATNSAPCPHPPAAAWPGHPAPELLPQRAGGGEGCWQERGTGTPGLDSATRLPPWPPPKDTPQGLIHAAEASWPHPGVGALTLTTGPRTFRVLEGVILKKPGNSQQPPQITGCVPPTPPTREPTPLTDSPLQSPCP